MQGRTLSGRKMADEITEPTTYAARILQGLQDMRVYQDTVKAKVKASRRAAGKVAKAARKANR